MSGFTDFEKQLMALSSLGISIVVYNGECHIQCLGEDNGLYKHGDGEPIIQETLNGFSFHTLLKNHNVNLNGKFRSGMFQVVGFISNILEQLTGSTLLDYYEINFCSTEQSDYNSPIEQLQYDNGKIQFEKGIIGLY